MDGYQNVSTQKNEKQFHVDCTIFDHDVYILTGKVRQLKHKSRKRETVLIPENKSAI